MAELNATTPQSRLFKEYHDANVARDTEKIGSLLAKNFRFKTFPSTPDLPDETKEGYIRKYGGMFTLLEKVEVRINERKPRLEFVRLTDICCV